MENNKKILMLLIVLGYLFKCPPKGNSAC